jgi:outer membrane receptor protein involved in Fe transport
MKRSIDLTAIALAIGAAAIGSAGHAQDVPADNAQDRDGADLGGDIVVTAQRREERLIDVPQSVTAISAEMLMKLNATQFRDFANTVPGLVFQTAGAGATQVSLRGVTAGIDVSSTVGIYVDEVPYGTSTTFARSGRYTPDGNIQDIARVEVLRGPQGTLYGASAMGGVLKYVSKLPNSNDFATNVRAGISSTRHGGTNYEGAAAVNVPIAQDRLALRVSGFYAHDGGYIDNPRLGLSDVNRSNIYGARADLLFTPTEALSIRLTGEFQNIDRRGAGEVDYTFGFLNAATISGELTQDRFLPEPFASRFRVVSGTVTYDFGGAKLTSITSYQETRVQNNFDYTKAMIFGPGLTQLTDRPFTDKFTQELRLGASLGTLIDLTVGGFYTHEKSGRNSEVIYRNPATGAIVPNLFVLSTPSTYKEYAGFANATLNITEKFDITGGVRLARNEQAYTQIGAGFARTLPTTRSSETVATYLANVRYRFSSNATAYARFATGYRPGGPNFIAVGIPTPPSFDADRLNSYELGFKGQTGDRSFGIDAAVYHIDWKDIQTFDLSSPFGGYINGPNAKIDGAEIALTARPTAGLTFSSTFALQDARLAEDSANFGARKGDRLPNVPKYTVAVLGDYEIPLGEVRPTIGATLRFVSDRLSAFSRSTSQRKLGDYTQVDLRAGATFGTVDVQAYVRNLFDTRGQLSSVGPDGMPPRVATTQPRTVGVSTSLHF